MTQEEREEKFNMLQDALLELYVDAVKNKQISIKDAGNIVTFLKNNKVVQEKKILSEADIIDGLVEK